MGIGLLEKYILPMIDILIVGYLIYTFYQFISGTRTSQILRGIGLIALAYFVGSLARLNTFIWLFNKLLEVGALAVIVIFQKELKEAVTKLGEKTRWIKWFQGDQEDLETIIEASNYLAGKRIGALIILERKTRLKSITDRGVSIDSRISKELIECIFSLKSPLHDGAMVIEKDRILSCGCVLPLTDREDLSQSFGTRHRAGLGVTEESDAVSIIISEESGKISVASEGDLYVTTKGEGFENLLKDIFFNQSEKEKKARRMRELKNKILRKLKEWI